MLVYESPCDSIINSEKNRRGDRRRSDAMVLGYAGILNVSVIVR